MSRLHRGKLLVRLTNTKETSQSFLDEVTGLFQVEKETNDEDDDFRGGNIDFSESSSGSEYLPSDFENNLDDEAFIDDETLYDDCLDEATGLLTRNYKEGGRKRKHNSKGRADKSTWKRQRAKIARLQGEQYEGFQKDENGKYKQTLLRPAKALKGGCIGHYAPLGIRGGPRQQFLCSDLTGDIRKNIFLNFWKIGSWEARKVYVRSLVEIQIPQHRRKNTAIHSAKKSKSYKYFLSFFDNNETKRVLVCKKMFLSTLGLGSRQIRSWTENVDDELSNIAVTRIELSNSIAEFLESLPTMESHYCRASSKKKYLEPIWDSVTGDLYEEYLNYCNLNNKKTYCKSSFSKKFTELDYAIFRPRKDQCNKCLAFKNNNLTQEEYDKHQTKKENAREEKSNDKEKPEKGTLVFTMDVQAVMLCPRIQASATYYKTKLKVHNSTHYNLQTGDAVCYLWHEGNGGLESDIFASILTKHLTVQIEQYKPTNIIIWSDGCGYQNRSVVVANALLELAIEKEIIIEQKYLEVGHTQMEVDTMHSAIERKLPSHREIYVPADYIKIIKSARRFPEPYKIEFLNYSDFFKCNGGRYSSIRPGNKKGEPYVVDICALQYLPDGKIRYKLDFKGDYEYLPRRANGHPITKTRLYDNPVPIDAVKYLHLQEMKPLMPRDYHPFYDHLEHSCDAEDNCPHKRPI